MFKRIANWWNRNENRFNDLEAKLTNVADENAKLVQARIEIEQQKAELESELQIIRTEKEEQAARKSGKEPWVDVRSAEFHAELGLQVDLDWNPPFIQYLKDNGIKGKTEQIIIQKWLAFLYEDLIGKLEEETVEESMATKSSPGEFE